MNTIELTTTEFRQSQKKFLDMASKGVSIFIHRGKEMFMLNRVRPTVVMDDETMNDIAEVREQSRSGEVTAVTTPEELKAFMDSL